MPDTPGPTPPPGSDGDHLEHVTPGLGSRADMKRAEAELDQGLFQTRYREVTLAAIIFGVIVGVVMNAAITYAGLKIGFTIVGSSIAAVLGFGVLRGLLRKGSILEVNIGQTIGSAVNTPNSGVIFTVPVLFLIGVPLVDGRAPNTNFWLLTIACVTGAILGGAFIIPLRKQMLDIERLRFPSATAVGAILKSPGAGAKKSIVLVVGILISALLAAPYALPAITRPAAQEELTTLVEEEKFDYEALLRTEMIASWIENEAAPPEVIKHATLIGDLKLARAAVNADCEDPSISPANREAQLDAARANEANVERELENAKKAAFAAVAAATKSGPYAVTNYQDELANRALAATNGELEWDALHATQAGWAAHPLPGYADVNMRMGAQEEADVDHVDYAYNGLGGGDPVLSRKVDRDGNGKPDLLIDDENIDAGRIFGLPDDMQLLFALAPFALGAGYLTGRAGLYVLAGGVLSYLIINPALFSFLGVVPETISADQAPAFLYRGVNRPLGIGLLLGGAMMGVMASAPAIKEALKSIAASGGGKAARDELGIKVLITAVVLGAIFLFGAADFLAGRPINTADPVSNQGPVCVMTSVNGYTVGFESEETLSQFNNFSQDEQNQLLKPLKADSPGLLAKFGLNRHMRALIIALIGAGWIWFAGIIIAQCTGMTDWSPISGMALITVVLVLVLAGVGDQLGAVMIGAALCVAITCAADMMADLKTGYIVGAQPKRQQIVELVSTGVGPIISMFVLLLIAAANMEKFGIPMGEGTDTTAPQAQALQAVITGVQGGEMPYMLYGLGALAGALLGLGSFSGLGVLVGLSMYLPMNYIATYGLGCIINMIVVKVKGRTWAEEWGVPLAAGFIVGDALLGLSVNFIVLLQS